MKQEFSFVRGFEQGFKTHCRCWIPEMLVSHGCWMGYECCSCIAYEHSHMKGVIEGCPTWENSHIGVITEMCWWINLHGWARICFMPHKSLWKQNLLSFLMYSSVEICVWGKMCPYTSLFHYWVNNDTRLNEGKCISIQSAPPKVIALQQAKPPYITWLSNYLGLKAGVCLLSLVKCSHI